MTRIRATNLPYQGTTSVVPLEFLHFNPLPWGEGGEGSEPGEGSLIHGALALSPTTPMCSQTLRTNPSGSVDYY